MSAALFEMSKWFTRESENVFDNNKPTIYRDIFEEGTREPIAERVSFDAAEKLVEKHNEEIERRG